MFHKIQAGVAVENCIKCGRRPVVKQIKNEWLILCPHEACKNVVRGKLLNFDEWERLNKKED